MAGVGFVLLLAYITASCTQGLHYHCTSGSEQTAHTPSATFQLSSTQDWQPLSTCTLTLPRHLFRSQQSKLMIVIEALKTTASCALEALVIGNKSYRYCGQRPEPRVLELEYPTIDFTVPQISYSTSSSLSNSSFYLKYVVYNDICATSDVIATTPLVIHQYNTSRSTCVLNLSVSRSDRLIITALTVDSESDICSYTDDIYLKTDAYAILCQGQQCLTSTGLNVTGVKTVMVVMLPGFICGLYWKVVAQSQSADMDICSHTGSHFTLPQGSVNSPGYPMGSSGPLNCTVFISGFEVVAVAIKYYNLKQRQCQNPLGSNPCSCSDRLTINGTSVCGQLRDGKEKAYVNEEALAIQLVTAADLQTNEGLYLVYRGYSNATDICTASSLELSSPLVVKSPSFPKDYTADSSCQTMIDVTSVDKVDVRFLVFSLEEGEEVEEVGNCRYDYLSIQGQRLCGHRAGEVRKLDLSSVDKLSLYFKSDNTGNLAGFYISIEIPITTPTPATTSVSTSVSMPPTSIRSTITAATVSAATSSNRVSTSPPNLAAPLQQKELEDVPYTNTIPAVTLASVPTVDSSAVERRKTIHTTTESVHGAYARTSEKGASQSCPVPWYYWVISLIALLLAVLVTISFFLIKLKRLKVIKYTPSEADTESSRDGLSNPAYYNTSPHLNGNTLLTNSYYSSRDRLAGKRVYINKNSVQTTV